MKTLLALATLLVLSATAQGANTLEFDFRGDWQSLDYNEAAALPDYTRFYLKTGRLQYKGSVNDRFSYVLRLGFYKPAADAGGANAKRDSLNSSVEYAYVTDKMSDMFSLSLGRLNTDIGGFEGATSGAELYMVSPYYAGYGLTGSNVGINESGVANMLYMTGAKGTFTFAETQNVALVVVNNGVVEPVDAGGNFNQNRGLVGLTWKGGFMDKALTGLLSYHEVSPQTPTGNNKDKHNYVTAGMKYEDPTWVGYLEYSTTTYKDGASGLKDEVFAGIAKFGYKMEQWTPRLELFTSEEKRGITVTETNKFMGYGAVLEYKPTPENFRYHLAYNSITTKPATGDDKIRTEIVLGARLLGDFLK